MAGDKQFYQSAKQALLDRQFGHMNSISYGASSMNMKWIGNNSMYQFRVETWGESGNVDMKHWQLEVWLSDERIWHQLDGSMYPVSIQDAYENAREAFNNAMSGHYDETIRGIESKS